MTKKKSLEKFSLIFGIIAVVVSILTIVYHAIYNAGQSREEMIQLTNKMNKCISHIEKHNNEIHVIDKEISTLKSIIDSLSEDTKNVRVTIEKVNSKYDSKIDKLYSQEITNINKIVEKTSREMIEHIKDIQKLIE